MTAVYMTHAKAVAALPAGAAWSASFGNPGERFYTEYWRTQDGRTFILSDGGDEYLPHDWTVREAMPA